MRIVTEVTLSALLWQIGRSNTEFDQLSGLAQPHPQVLRLPVECVAAVEAKPEKRAGVGLRDLHAWSQVESDMDMKSLYDAPNLLTERKSFP